MWNRMKNSRKKIHFYQIIVIITICVPLLCINVFGRTDPATGMLYQTVEESQEVYGEHETESDEMILTEVQETESDEVISTDIQETEPDEAISTEIQEIESDEVILTEVQETEENPQENIIESEDLYTQAAEGPAKITYDPQPLTMVEIQMVIMAYETEYQAVLSEEGFLAALGVPKPRWQHEVPAELMPDGYNCQLVDWDEDFGAEYYTFFPNSNTIAYGEVEYIPEPPDGPDITEAFNLGIGDSKVDNQYKNIAVITKDRINQFGAMWAKEPLDLRLHFKTEMYLHLEHSANPPLGLPSQKVADGMTFTMHNYPPALTEMIGGRGEGLGVWRGRYSNDNLDGRYLPNALVIEFDTYQNTGSSSCVIDPLPPNSYSNAHCSLLIPKACSPANPITERDHNNTFFFETEKKWVKFEVEWTPDSSGSVLGGTLAYTFNGVTNEYKIPDVKAAFAKDSPDPGVSGYSDGTKVWWGFTGATGAQTAVQAAAITRLPMQVLSVVKTVENTDGADIDNGFAKERETISYTIKVTAEKTFANIGSIVVTDVLSPYVEYAGGNVTVITNDSSKPSFEVEPSIEDSVMIIDTGHILRTQGDWLEITFNVLVKGGSAGNIVYNSAEANAFNLYNSEISNITKVTIVKTSGKYIASDSEAGTDGAAVKVGDVITYEINYVNSTGRNAGLTITDNLPEGTEYVSHTGNGTYFQDDNKVVWQISNIEAGASGSVFLKIRITENIDIDNNLVNTAVLEWSTGLKETPGTENPILKYKVIYVGNGGSTMQDKTVYEDGFYPIGGDYFVLSNDDVGFIRHSYRFKGWNTQLDGLGTDYIPGVTIFSVTGDIVLYAQWEKLTSFTLLKVDAKDYAVSLPGAEFDLYYCTNDVRGHPHTELTDTDTCWEYIKSGESDTDGLVHFHDLVSGTYLLAETRAPDGYNLPVGQWIFIVDAENETISSDGYIGTAPPALADGAEDADILVTNIARYELPAMGGKGTFAFTGIGSLLLVYGVWTGLRFCHRKKI